MTEPRRETSPLEENARAQAAKGWPIALVVLMLALLWSSVEAIVSREDWRAWDWAVVWAGASVTTLLGWILWRTEVKISGYKRRLRQMEKEKAQRDALLQLFKREFRERERE